MKTKLVLIRGIPGAGKTSIAEKVAKTLNFYHIDPDLLNTSSVDYKKYAEELVETVPERRIIYRYLLKKTVECLNNNKSVIWSQPWRILERLDLTIRNIYFFLKKEEKWDEKLSDILKELNIEIIVIEITTPHNTAFERLKKRYKDNKHKWDGNLFDEHIKRHEKFTLPIQYYEVENTDNLDTAVKNVIHIISNC